MTQELLVELNDRSVGDLQWLKQADELNGSTVVNRAIQVYRRVLEVQMEGGTVAINGKPVLFT